MTLTATLAAIAMAFGAPLVYADQARNIIKHRNAEGFTKDVCAVLLIANICRCFFWIGERFEFALLLQSILMIAAQLYLLSLLIKFRPGSFASSSYSVSSSDQPGASADSSAAPASKPTATTTPSSAGASQPSNQFNYDVQPPTPLEQEDASNPWKAGLGGLKSGGLKGYAPLLENLSLPAAPVLGYEDEEGEDGETNEGGSRSKQQRIKKAGTKTVRFLQAGFRMGSGKRLDGSSGSRPFGFWTWQTLSSYLIFLLLLIVFLGLLQLLLGSFSTYVTVLGYFALGLESTLPIPQAITNQRRKSLSGFRWSVLAGWLFGDMFKTVYFLIQASPMQFTVCALFALSVDLVICAQMYFFRHKTAQDEEEQRLNEAEALEVGRSRGRPGDEEASLESRPLQEGSATSHFRIEADEDEDDVDGK